MIGLLAVAGLIYLSRSILPLMIFSAILAYLFHPLVTSLQRLRVPRAIGTLLSFLLLTIILALAPILLIPAIIREVRAIRIDWAELGNGIFAWGQGLLDLRTAGDDGWVDGGLAARGSKPQAHPYGTVCAVRGSAGVPPGRS